LSFFKDEYEKKHDFYDEYHEDGGSEKHGGWHEEHEGKKGGHEKKGHLHAGHHDVIKIIKIIFCIIKMLTFVIQIGF